MIVGGYYSLVLHHGTGPDSEICSFSMVDSDVDAHSAKLASVVTQFFVSMSGRRGLASCRETWRLATLVLKEIAGDTE